MDISIIILNYKSKDLTMNCLKSIKQADFAELRYEIIVVDNGSNDGLDQEIKKIYSDIIFIQNVKNLGMGGGNNVGIKQARGKYYVIMNPDTVAFKDTFIKMYEFMQSNQPVGVAGPLQFNHDYSVGESYYRWHNFLTPFYRRTFLEKFSFARKELDRYLMRDFDGRSTAKVDWLLGSFLFCRRAATDEIGMFDERFFLYFEDTDLCRRFWEKGWQVVYYPEAKIIHNHARLSAKTPWYLFFGNKAAWSHIFSWLKYLNKWGFKQPKFVV